MKLYKSLLRYYFSVKELTHFTENYCNTVYSQKIKKIKIIIQINFFIMWIVSHADYS